MKNVILATHISPVIHGQAYMARMLVRVSDKWDGVQLHVLNTVYSDERSNLGSFSFGKLIKLVKYSLRLRKKIKEHSVNCVILTPSFKIRSLLKDYFLSAVGINKKVKRIGWVHMDPKRLDYESRSAVMKHLARKYISSFDVFVACSESLVSTWPKWIREISVIKVVSNTIDTEELLAEKQGDKKILAPKNDSIKLVFYGAIERQKGWKEFYDAATYLSSIRTDLEFHFFGPAIDLSKLELKDKYFNSNTTEKKIYWHGTASINDKAAVFEMADIVVFPTYTEQLSLSLLEAMYLRKINYSD